MEINFKKQIDDDIQLIQAQYSYLDSKINTPEYAFNYWVLSRLYGIDEEIAPNYITDINDKGIDCFVHYEDTKELYLIQNKYNDLQTIVKRDDVSDFLTTPIQILLNGSYKRSADLQKIFDRAISDSDYKIWLHFYVTNNYKSNDIKTLIDNFSVNKERTERIKANIYAQYSTINDIQQIYYGDRFTEKRNFTAKLPTRRAGTSLDVRPDEYDLKWMIDLRYVLVNVYDLYKIYRNAVSNNYQLFEENIREYLGAGKNNAINNGIISTLKDPNDRENFFYYNNGITIICESCKTLRGSNASNNDGNYYGFELSNPQIVNGCQTINSIAEVLSHYNDEDIKKEFDKTFVLVKVFVFDKNTKAKHPNLDLNIVRYTNSQNAISDKAFASKINFFLNIQNEFKKRGFLLLAKPSDKNTFTTEFSDSSKFAGLNIRNSKYFDFFDIERKNITSTMIELEKLLKVLLSFVKDGFTAFTKGSAVLKPNSNMYKDFSLNIVDYLTIDNMLRLFLVYIKAEDQKKNKDSDKRYPIPYYVVGFLGSTFKNKTFEKTNEKLDLLFSDKELFDEVYEFYAKLTKLYSKEYTKSKNVDYNVMIKQDIDYSTLNHCIDLAKMFDCSDKLLQFIEI